MTQEKENHSLFDLLILSLGNAALIELGLVPEPGRDELKKDLDAAKYNIMLLEVLHEKTKGNLAPTEKELLTSLITDLRTKFVEARK